MAQPGPKGSRPLPTQSPQKKLPRPPSTDVAINSGNFDRGPNRALPTPPVRTSIPAVATSTPNISSRLTKNISSSSQPDSFRLPTGSGKFEPPPRSDLGPTVAAHPSRLETDHRSLGSGSRFELDTRSSNSGRFEQFKRTTRTDSARLDENKSSGRHEPRTPSVDELKPSQFRTTSNEYDPIKEFDSANALPKAAKLVSRIHAAHHRNSPSSGAGSLDSDSSSTHTYTDSDEFVALPSSSQQASVEVVKVQHADAVMFVGATGESDSQVREEIRLMTILRDIQNQYGENSAEALTPLEELAALFEESGNYERRRDVLSKLVDLKVVLFGDDHPNISDSLAELGRACLVLGDDVRANETLERALRIDEMEWGLDHYNLAKTLVLLGHTYARLGKIPEQRASSERAVKVLDPLDDCDDYPELTEALSLASDAYQKMGDHVHQLESSLRELRVRSEQAGPNNIALVPVMRTLANAYDSLGQFQNEKEILEQATKIQDADPTENDSPKLIWTLSMLARTYSQLEEFESARTTLQRVLGIKRKRYGPTTSTVLQTLWELAGVADDLNELGESQRYLDESLSLSEELYGPRDRRVAFVLAYLALCHAKQGDASILMDSYQRSLATLEEIYGVNHVIFANTLKLFGKASCELGDFTKQRKILKKVLTLEQSLHEPGSEPIAITMAELGRCEGRLGNLVVQRELQEQALQFLTRFDSPLHIRSRILLDLARCYTDMGEHELARDALLRLTKLEERAHGPDSVLVALTLLQLGKAQCYYALNDLETGRVAHKRCSIVLRKQFHGDTHPILTELDLWTKRFSTKRV